MLSADVITRYLRLYGEDVISVSGSDAYGTPILLAAEDEEIDPQDFVQNKHTEFVNILRKWNISLDNYTVTTTDTHHRFVQSFYTDLIDQDCITQVEDQQYYCEKCERFLPDRFVVGTCPICGLDQARGDQCSNDNCNVPLTPFEIVQPACVRCNTIPVTRSTTHWYFTLDQFTVQILDYLSGDIIIPDSFRKEAISFVERGLEGRALTRDLQWGIPASAIFKSPDDKVFYVWAEDVLGYISATLPLLNGRSSHWKTVWENANVVCCLGKDNLFYHGIWFPALQIASSTSYSLPETHSITHFIQFEGKGFSKSKGIGIWADEALELAPAEYWRFYLIYHRPEKRDTNFTRVDFVRTINKHLVNTIGNSVVRVISLIHKFNDGKIHQQAIENQTNIEFLNILESKEGEITDLLYTFSLKRILRVTLEYARLINLHLEETRPWNISNPKQRNEVLNVVYRGLVRLSLWLSPILPVISDRITDQLGLSLITLKDVPLLEDKYIPESIPKRTFFLEKLTLDQL